jgi:hypothetical protein
MFAPQAELRRLAKREKFVVARIYCSSKAHAGGKTKQHDSGESQPELGRGPLGGVKQ